MRWLSVLATCASLAIGSVAHAQTVSVTVSGRGASAVRERIERELSNAGMTVGDSDAVAAIEGEVGRAGRRRWGARMRLTVRGSEQLSETITHRRRQSLARLVGRWTRNEAVPVISGLAGGAAPAQEPAAQQEPERQPAAVAEAEDEPEASGAGPRSDGRQAPMPLRFELGGMLASRQLSFHDDIFAELRPYELPLWPFVHLGFEYFLGHHFPDMDGLWGLSFYAQSQFTFALTSRNENLVSFPTTAWGLDVGARYRLFVDDVALIGDVAYRTWTFNIEDLDDASASSRVPGVEYHGIRIGAGYQWEVGFGFFFTGSAGYTIVLAAGDILSDDWFPRGEAGGADIDLGFGQRVDDFEFRARFGYRRYFFSFNPQPGDGRVAGGALDETFQALVDIAYTPSF